MVRGKDLFLQLNEKPFVLHEEEGFAIVYKPPNMHCARQAGSNALTLLDWYSEIFPPALNLPGRNKGEGGLMHRLDFQTRGLVLFAKNQQSFEYFFALQNNGQIIKEYSAVCEKTAVTAPGFPPSPRVSFFPAVIESYFRPFGPGRKAVRPALDAGKRKEIATDKGKFYRTEIIRMEEKARHGCPRYYFSIKIARGFRHQIRCHLAWAGYPIVNDNLYGGTELPQEAPAGQTPLQGTLGLCSCGISFVDLEGKLQHIST